MCERGEKRNVVRMEWSLEKYEAEEGALIMVGLGHMGTKNASMDPSGTAARDAGASAN